MKSEALIRARLANNQLVFGFGHAVLRVEDPRATVFYDYAKQHFHTHPLVKIALLLRTEGSRVLRENPKISDPYPNVDAMSGTVLVAAGFDILSISLFFLDLRDQLALQFRSSMSVAKRGKEKALLSSVPNTFTNQEWDRELQS